MKLNQQFEACMHPFCFQIVVSFYLYRLILQNFKYFANILLVHSNVYNPLICTSTFQDCIFQTMLVKDQKFFYNLPYSYTFVNSIKMHSWENKVTQQTYKTQISVVLSLDLTDMKTIYQTATKDSNYSNICTYFTIKEQ